jgi:hypothetical protein
VFVSLPACLCLFMVQRGCAAQPAVHLQQSKPKSAQLPPLAYTSPMHFPSNNDVQV